MPDKEKNIITDKYNIYGRAFHIQSSQRRLLNTIRKYWGAFYCKTSSLKPKAIFYITRYDRLNQVRKSRLFYNDNFLLMLLRGRCITCNLYKMPWQIYIQHVKEAHINFIYFYVFEPVFLNILKRLNLFHLHSAAVTKNGRGILFPGTPGSGKSTAALSLLRENFKIISDDEVFLTKRGTDVYGLGIDKDISITEETISFFPEYRFLKGLTRYKKGNHFKRRLETKKLFPTLKSQKSKISLLIFPKISPKQKTRIEPLSRHQTLYKMLKQKPKEYKSLIRDKVTLPKQFELYSALTESARGYNLYIGKKSDTIPGLIA